MLQGITSMHLLLWWAAIACLANSEDALDERREQVSTSDVFSIWDPSIWVSDSLILRELF